MKAKTIARYGLLTALMLVLGMLERQFILVPSVPGIRLGLANTVLLYALCFFSSGGAWLLMLLKVGLSVLYAVPTSMAYSLAGGLLSMLAMTLALRARFFGLPGVSVCGAVCHMAGQVLFSRVMLGSWAALVQTPLLLVAAVATGVLTGIIAQGLAAALSRTDADVRRRMDALGLSPKKKEG